MTGDREKSRRMSSSEYRLQRKRPFGFLYHLRHPSRIILHDSSIEDLDTDVFWPSPKSKMSRAPVFGWSLLAWVGVGLFWFVTTRGFHPSRTLAIVVTVSLVTAYAIASYLNHLVLIPQYWRTGHYFRYVTWLIASMVLLTAAAFAVLRTWYIASLGPGRDPGGLYINYAIDLFGMAVHLLLAAFLVRLVGSTQRKSGIDEV
jgi:hypothetical protein